MLGKTNQGEAPKAASPSSAAAPPVALVSMPMLSCRDPSYQLALLKPLLERAGYAVETSSLFMYFGRWAGWRLQEVLSDVRPSMVGEWLWSKAAYDYEGDPPAYLAANQESLAQVFAEADCDFADLVRLRDEGVPEFLEFCLEAVEWSRFGLIGFSVVFQQLGASVALARAIKRRHPDIPIIFGGASFEDDIADELLRRVDAVDYVHCGDGEESFPELVRRLYAGESMTGLRGLMWRNRTSEEQIEYAGRAPSFMDLDRLPALDFDEYFHARDHGGYASSGIARRPWLPIETARGCWWGMKHQCTFCGLNRAGIEFRSMSATRVLEMMRDLSRRYGLFAFNAIDNIIDPNYVDELFGALAEQHTNYIIHYEARANLGRRQLRRMKQGGLYSLQAGVESLNTRILSLMRKKITAVRSLEHIKWCTYYGVKNLYNILVGFAGERAEDYAEQVELIGKIGHLEPPYAAARVRADRGSPMQTDADALGIQNLRPSRPYAFIFPPHFDLPRIAYYFEHDSDQMLPAAAYAELFAAVATWRGRWREGAPPFLRYRKGVDTLFVEDGRARPVVRTTIMDDRARLYEWCHEAKSRERIAAQFTGAWVDDALQDFVTRGLMVYLDRRYLSLALPMNRDW